MTAEGPNGSVLLLFLDGVGIGPADAAINPFLTAPLPNLRAALGGNLPTLQEPEVQGDGGCTFPLDACLGVEGTPQSGTGQVALLTGHNGAKLFGRHFGPWTPVRLRPLVTEESILARALERGLSTTFANAYPRGFLESAYGRRPAGPPLAAHGAGLLTRHEEDLARGQAVASEMVNTGWIARLGFSDLPEVTPEEAGANLARIAAGHDVTLYAHYSTDSAGHRGGMEAGVRALVRVDRFLGGLMEAMPDHLGVLVTSDHGNIEDVRGGHTRNPALGLALGPLADRFSRAERRPTSLMDVVEFLVGPA
jgi:2,3-bisphosphoglycerate-independent phosphoglycerate mutase